MGYDLHITRANHWAENDGAEIESDEWLALVAADPELTLDGSIGKYFANWSGKSRYPEPWLDLSSGNIMTKNPDPSIIKKMIALAEKLGGCVQGDDGETYLADGRVKEGGGEVIDGLDWTEESGG